MDSFWKTSAQQNGNWITTNDKRKKGVCWFPMLFLSLRSPWPPIIHTFPWPLSIMHQTAASGVFSFSPSFHPYHSLWRKPDALSWATSWDVSHSSQGALLLGLGGELGGRFLQAELSHDCSPSWQPGNNLRRDPEPGPPSWEGGSQSQSGLLTQDCVKQSEFVVLKPQIWR